MFKADNLLYAYKKVLFLRFEKAMILCCKSNPFTLQKHCF